MTGVEAQLAIASAQAPSARSRDEKLNFIDTNCAGRHAVCQIGSVPSVSRSTKIPDLLKTGSRYTH